MRSAGAAAYSVIIGCYIALTSDTTVSYCAQSTRTPEEIVIAYFECFSTKDTERFKDLFEENALSTYEARIGGKKVTNYYYPAYLAQNTIETWKIVTVERHETYSAMTVQYQMKGLSVGSGTIYVTQAGKIRYAPILEHHHPGLEIAAHIGMLMHKPSSASERAEALSALRKWAIPLFGYTEEMHQQEKEKATSSILDWWRRNYNVFSDKRGIALSKSDQEEIVLAIRLLSHSN